MSVHIGTVEVIGPAQARGLAQQAAPALHKALAAAVDPRVNLAIEHLSLDLGADAPQGGADDWQQRLERACTQAADTVAQRLRSQGTAP